jgi:3-oxoacyl-[acyl-carrier-protein] synthase II
MRIAGIGMICSRGLGMAAFENALESGWQKPGDTAAHWLGGRTTPAYLVDLNTLPDRRLLKKVRRSDHLSKMAVLAAADALNDGGMGDVIPKKIGVIVASAFGPHVTTFDFLDDFLDHGDAAVSPTTFSNSVHIAPASYISMSMNIKGPTLSVTQFRFSFQAALQLAQTWLDQRRCDHVLLGAVEQYGDVLGYVMDHKLTSAADGRIKPFAFKPTCQIPGEGAVFFLVSNGNSGNAYGVVNAVHINDDPDSGKTVDLDIIDADGMLPDESAYLGAFSPDTPVTAYSPLFGSMMIGGAFNLAAGALMLKRQRGYAAPVQDNPHGIHLLSETGNRRMESIRCTGYDCYGERTSIYVSRE